MGKAKIDVEITEPTEVIEPTTEPKEVSIDGLTISVPPGKVLLRPKGDENNDRAMIVSPSQLKFYPEYEVVKETTSITIPQGFLYSIKTAKKGCCGN